MTADNRLPEATVSANTDGCALDLLIAAGHITPVQVARARDIARGLLPRDALAARDAEAGDAARYRWLRERVGMVDGRVALGLGPSRFNPAETDAAIDAALQADTARAGEDGRG
jgi:hypothetical protein